MDWDVPKIIPRQPGVRKLWLTADEHYGHSKIIGYQNRPFSGRDEMDAEIQRRHNSVVEENDVVIHVGDFCFGNGDFFEKTATGLAGTHFFMDGSHDRAMREFFSARQGGGKINLLPKLFEFTFQKTKIVLCHYAMHSWWASHYRDGSVHFHGHSHGRFSSPFQAIDIGVDTNDFYPYSIENAISLALRKMEPRAGQATPTECVLS